MNRKLWMICLAVWLLLYALFSITSFQVQLGTFVMGVLAVVTAVLLFLDR